MATIPSHVQLQIPQPTSPVSFPIATTLSFSSLTPNNHCHLTICHHIRHRRAQNICYADNSTKNNISTKLESEKEPDNPLLKVAWYTSELLGIAASLFRSPPEREADSGNSVLAVDERGSVDRGLVVDSIKQDFQRSYFVTGNLTLDAYKEDCEFADPAGSFKGLRRFKRNCTNFGTLLDKSDMKLMKWEDFEDKGIGHWRFSCVLSFPWKPILSVAPVGNVGLTNIAISFLSIATGYTEYYFDQQSGKVCRHVEYWNVPKMALFKQMLRPSKNRSKGG